MSLGIPCNSIIEVMIGNKWYLIEQDSFVLDAYEYWTDKSFSDKRFFSFAKESGVTYEGFSFRDAEDGGTIAGPVTSIQAVKYA
jgi:hypothetical protein